MENLNTIEKIEFQIQIENEKAFPMLSDEIPEAIVENLEAFMDKTLLELGIHNQQLIIPRLELNLGKLNLNHFKQDLIDKFKLFFLKEIQQTIKAPQVSSMSQADRAFFIVKYYIKFGSRPWWLEKDNNQLEFFFHQAYEAHPRKFINMLNGFYLQPIFRDRMLDALPENLLKKAIANQLKVNEEFFKIIKLLSSGSPTSAIR
jgi:hypothetical protein